MPTIDLNARIVSPDVRCWRLFPGSSYRFLEIFKNEGVAFLDMPGLKLPEGRLGDVRDLPKRIRESEIILEKIAKEGKEREHTVTEEELSKFKVGRRQRL